MATRSPMGIDVSFRGEQQEKKERRSRRSRPSVRMHRILPEDTSVETNGQQQEEDENKSIPGTRVFFVIKVLFGIIFFLIVLVCTVFSKLTLVSLTNKLRDLSFCNDTTVNPMCTEKIESSLVSLYWQLLLVMVIPTFIVFMRSLVFGVLGKTTQTYPWPKMKSAILGIVASILEVVAISVFVFLVMAELPPGISLLLLSGVFFCQIAIDIVCTKKICCGLKSKPLGYKNIEDSLQDSQENGNLDSQQEAITVSSVRLGKVRKILSVLKLLLENKTVKILALSLQFSSVVLFIALWCFRFMSFSNTGLTTDLYRTRPMIALPFCLLVLSVIWTNKFQDWITKINKHGAYDDRTARYKSSFINSSVRLVLYPFVTYIIFRYITTHKVDPWCMVPSDSPCLDFSGDTLSTFLVQIFTTMFAYLFAWIACTMTLSPYGMALPLLIATPLSAICYYVHMYGFQYLSFLSFYKSESIIIFGHAYPWAPIILGFLWVGQILGIGFYIFTKRNIILSEDSNMFLTPSYDGVFFEQHMILNRQVKKTGASENEMTFMGNVILRSLRTIFICSTMYRENVVEMRQMLTSIRRVALNYEREKRINRQNCDSYESHIFFDGALNGTQLQDFGLQLLSLLEETLEVKPKDGIKKITPYGMCLQYRLNKVEPMSFYIHFKDKNLVKPKKRWSQVMYINYVINYRIQNDPKLTANNTFILTTDADIDFTAKSAVVLLDMLETNPKIGAVCARTHPKGSGPMYWYQVFDYAIGHWFQKPAEHLLGCVLCSPGCFSVFRCSALQEVIETYSTLATNGMEFLMKDMGEDRWLCTLLIKKGWRLEYCAISEDQTYCPLEFGEFFGQRRRWIPSTIANLSLLISETTSITRKNDTVSVLFILFQAIMVFSTAISPATVILLIASGLQSAFSISDELTYLIIALLIFVSVIYGMVCLFASPKSQIDVAKVLSFIFAIVMLTVFVGILQGVIQDIFPDPDLTFLKSPNCSAITGQNITGDIAKCKGLSRYLDSLPNTLPQGQFKLPVSISVIYLGIFAVTFIVAALLHPTEFTCLFHFIWYILALPSGYLLLLIYSAANLDSQSWGTREGSSGKDKGLLGWGKYFKIAWNKLVSCCVQTRCCKPDQDIENITTAKEAPKKEQEDSSSSHEHHSMADIDYVKMSKEARKWLLKNGCSEDYVQMFSENGYTTEHYIAAMALKDLEEIGIDKRGFRLRLAKAAKRLPGLPIHVDVPEDVGTWLRNLEMTEYTQLFMSEGYEAGEDIENLKGLTKKDLQGMGITKRAHLQRLTKALHSLAYPKEVELQMYHTKGVIENVSDVPLSNEETQFWKDLIVKKLKPVSTQLTAIEEIKESLRSLRNTVLVVLFLVNIMWIIALSTFKFPRLADYGIDPRAFQFLFLFVYGFIIIVQFLMMICHRGITLVHYFGRVRPYHVVIPPTGQLDFLNVSLKHPY